MADAAEGTVPSALDQRGNTTIWWVPTIADPAAPTVVEIGAAGAHRVTYSFTPDGWNLAGAQATVDDDRLTIPQALSSLDVNKVTLDLKYVDSADANSAALILLEGTSGFFVERRSVPQTQAITTGDKVRVIPCTLGAQNPGVINNTGKFLINQQTSIDGVVGVPVAVVAGA